MEQILTKITDRIRTDNQARFETFSPENAVLRDREKPREIFHSLQRGFFLIAEVKHGSPSKGIIREDYDPVALAASYERAGASAISVITEQNFFFGAQEHLQKVKENVQIPVLRKDFIIHPFQVYESYNLGADFLLLIVACLSDDELKRLYDQTLSLGMEALVEVHNEEEIERALAINPRLIGINNRNLKTFTVDIENAFRLKSLIPENAFVISESGIKTHEDIVRLRENGFAGALVGESLLRSENVAEAVRELLNGQN